ncbi:MAG: hypothetical protein OXG15_09795 [Gammaproteobacteria bacterium]|nr:hypothetical protein [Gammaproteobacteria bacterium]
MHIEVIGHHLVYNAQETVWQGTLDLDGEVVAIEIGEHISEHDGSQKYHAYIGEALIQETESLENACIALTRIMKRMKFRHPKLDSQRANYVSKITNAGMHYE